MKTPEIKMVVWTCAATVALGAATLALPSRAAPAASFAAFRPAFDAVICNARPPHVDMSFANDIHVVPGGSIIRVADTDITQADHAEVMFKLALLQGHLMIGRALIEAGQPKLALPHFGHPVRELYDDIRPEVAKRGLTQFDGDLIALEALATAKPNDPATMAQYDKVIHILDAIRATVPAELRDNEQFMLGVLGEVAGVGSEDYNESIENNRIAKPVEYHDSRGYLMYADGEMKRLEARPELKNSVKLKMARQRLTEMQAIVGPLLPPTRPIKTVAQYKAIVAQYKKAVAATGA